MEITTGEEIIDPPADHMIVNSRIISFPRELVYRAWTEPQHLAGWWGPKGFTNTFHEFNPVPGGAWRFIMHGPNGADYDNESVFVKLEKPSKIVLDHVSNPKFQVIATFEDAEGNTRITFRQVFASREMRDKIKVYAADANEQNLDRLEAELNRMSQ